jgi:ComF family protein
LRQVVRFPVCERCLEEPVPLDAEYFCISCRTPFVNPFPLDAEGRCALCRSGLRAFDAAYSFGSYGGALRQLIHLLKYDRMRPLAGPLSAFLLRSLPRDEAFDLIVPVPLHWRRQWKRGFNQSELLARGLSRSTGIPVSRALRRVKAGAAQAGLSNSARRRNVSQAFRCGAGEALRGKRVLLLDDVMTTGSTATACARALKGAGVARVALLTLARADRRFSGQAAGGINSMVGGNVRNAE